MRYTIRDFLMDKEESSYFYHWLNSKYFYEIGRLFDQLSEADFFPKKIEHCKLIDAGCGRGDFFPLFVRKGGKSIVGIDTSERSLSQAKKKIKCLSSDITVELLKSDMSHIGIASEMVDIMFSKGTLLLLHNPEQAVREMMRVTNRYGIIMVSYSEKGSILYWLHKSSPGIKTYTSNSLICLFNKYGAKCVLKHPMVYFYSPFGLVNPFGLLSWFLAKYCPHALDILDNFLRAIHRIPSHGMLVFIKQ